MNTNMTEFRWFSKIFHPCVLDENSLSIERDVVTTVNCFFRNMRMMHYGMTIEGFVQVFVHRYVCRMIDYDIP